jgi:hypothetical protein
MTSTVHRSKVASAVGSVVALALGLGSAGPAAARDPGVGVGAPGVGVTPGVGVGAPGVGTVDPGLNQPGVVGNVGGVARRSVRR